MMYSGRLPAQQMIRSPRAIPERRYTLASPRAEVRSWAYDICCSPALTAIRPDHSLHAIANASASVGESIGHYTAQIIGGTIPALLCACPIRRFATGNTVIGCRMPIMIRRRSRAFCRLSMAIQMQIKLFRVILPVPEVNQATKFYQELLKMPGTRVSSGRHYFDCGGTILVCYDPRADGDETDATPNPQYIYFAVSDLDAVFARAQSGGFRELDDSIRTRSWGERSFYGIDPFGNPICFVDERTAYRG